MPIHSEQRILPFTPEQLFKLVSDIESYPDFLPWCSGAYIRKREGNIIIADLVVGYKGMREKFTSIVTLDPNERISVEYGGGSLKCLKCEWGFKPAKGGTCELSFYVDFSMRSKILGGFMGVFFDKAFSKMVAAFEARADKMYKRI